jgi:replicative DNA helicase
MARQPPHDLEAEESLLGAMLLSANVIDVVSESVLASDFYKPSYAIIYDAITRLRAKGGGIDAVTVMDEIQGQGLLDMIGDPSIFISLQANTPSIANGRHYADIIMEHALRRRMVTEGQEWVEQAYNVTYSAHDVLETHQAVVAEMGAAIVDSEPDDVSVEEFMQRERESVAKWVIHGLIRRQHKLMLIAPEGSGKSVALRFIAVCAAYGIQPFRHDRVKPIRTLIVDLENPEDALFETFEMILRKVTDFNPQSETVNRLWWKPAGINLRNRADVAALENVIKTRRPDLVCLGPMYCAYENKPGESWEGPALEVQRTLKRLMVRYDFALMLEDHMPQADSHGKRPLRPYGSSMWRRWLDIGIGLEPTEEDCYDSFNLKHWKGSRTHTDWPTHIERGSVSGSKWPFVGEWR